MNELHRAVAGDAPQTTSAAAAVADPVSDLLADLIGEHRSIALVGVVDLTLSRLLSSRHCKTRITLTVTDLDVAPIATLMGSTRVDCIIFYNVLEALRQPSRVLDEARTVLNDSGAIVAITSNVSHGAIRLAQLESRLEQTEERRFDARGLDVLLLNAGYRIDRFERISHTFGSPSPLLPDVPDDVSADLRERIVRDPDFETLQFAFRATPLSDVARNRALARRLVAGSTEIVQAHSRINDLTGYAKKVETELARATQGRIAVDKRLKNALRLVNSAKSATVDAERVRKELSAISAAANALLRGYAEIEQRAGSLAEEALRRAHLLEEAGVAAARQQQEITASLSALQQMQDRVEQGRQFLEQAGRTIALQQYELGTSHVALQQALSERDASAIPMQVAIQHAEALERELEDAHARVSSLTTSQTELQATLLSEEEAHRDADRKYEDLAERFTSYVSTEIEAVCATIAVASRDTSMIRSGRIWRLRRFFRNLFGDSIQ